MTELVDPNGQPEMIGRMTQAIVDLAQQAREQNIEPVGPGGLLNELTKNVRPVHTAPSGEAARERFAEFDAKWASRTRRSAGCGRTRGASS
jgi:hypothetical protein